MSLGLVEMLRCTRCGKRGNCGCWELCSCGYTTLKGEPCRGESKDAPLLDEGEIRKVQPPNKAMGEADMNRRDVLKAAPGLLAGIGVLLSGLTKREPERVGFAQTDASEPIVGTVTIWVTNQQTGSIAYYTASH